jgi:hypothetical protein
MNSENKKYIKLFFLLTLIIIIFIAGRIFLKDREVTQKIKKNNLDLTITKIAALSDKYVNIYDTRYISDSQTFIYSAEKEGKWFTVIIGPKGVIYDGESIEIIFNSSYTNFAYQIKKGNKLAVVFNGKEGKEYNEIYNFNSSSITISPDGRRIAYGARQGDKWFIVIDDQEIGPYDDIYNELSAINFSPDSKQVVYGVKQNGKWLVVTDGKEGKKYDEIYDIGFEPYGKKVIYRAVRDKKFFVVIDDRENGPYNVPIY